MMQNILNDLLSAIFPRLCAACGKILKISERAICMRCTLDLPYTHAHLYQDNTVAQRFAGKVKINAAASMFYYFHGEKVRRMIHQFKYHGYTEVGTELGRMYGRELRVAESFKSLDVIVPVPLHKSKKKKRGYNQCEVFAEGLSSVMQVPYDFASLTRIVPNVTQTKHRRFNRYSNVDNIFKLTDPSALANKHVLLVDDVVTSGSTLTGCAETLLKVNGIKISIATMACV